jgi:predicted Zn-dependent protease
MRHGVTCIVLFALVASAGWAQVSAQREIRVGEDMAAALHSQRQMITDVEVTGFVERVLGTLSKNESLRLPIKVSVVDRSELIASALPGGQLVLSSGAILRTDNEAELAGLLSHALGHVQAGQSYRQAKYVGSIPLVFLGGWWGICARTSDGAGGILLPVGMREQSGLFESQADMLGLGYLTNAGYDPQALVSVFDRWTGKFRMDEDVKAKALALRNTTASTVLNTSDFDRIKARLAPPKATLRRAPTLAQ